MSKTIKNKLVFDTKDVSGKPLKLAVRKPNMEETKELQKVYNKAWKDALDAGASLSVEIKDLARKRNVWDDSKEKAYKDLQKELFESELKILKGGSAGLTKKKAKDLAFRMSQIRVELRNMTESLNELDSKSAENQAKNAEFRHALFLCTINPDTGDKFYTSQEDFEEKLSSKATDDASRYLGLLTHNLDPEYENNLPENKFLKQHGFIDDKLRLINEKGELIDSKGRRIRDDGKFINEKGELTDLDGNLVDEQGNYIVEFTPFLDEPEEDKTSEVDSKKTKA